MASLMKLGVGSLNVDGLEADGLGLSVAVADGLGLMISVFF